MRTTELVRDVQINVRPFGDPLPAGSPIRVIGELNDDGLLACQWLDDLGAWHPVALLAKDLK